MARGWRRLRDKARKFVMGRVEDVTYLRLDAWRRVCDGVCGGRPAGVLRASALQSLEDYEELCFETIDTPARAENAGGVTMPRERRQFLSEKVHGPAGEEVRRCCLINWVSRSREVLFFMKVRQRKSAREWGRDAGIEILHGRSMGSVLYRS